MYLVGSRTHPASWALVPELEALQVAAQSLLAQPVRVRAETMTRTHNPGTTTCDGQP